MAKVFLRSLASGRGSFVKTASVVPDGFEVAVDSELPTQSINQSMAVTDAGTKVPLYPYHTFYTLLVFKST